MSGIPAGAGQLLGKRLGKFDILALLALGGTAEIYLARIGGAAGFEKYVVVKCLHDHLADDTEFVKMFLDEARLAAHLDHSNIVQTMELGEHDGRYYMVMEFLAGLSLAMIVRRAAERMPNARIPVPLVLNILAQSCAGLHYAHEKAMNGRALNIVHRDISPQNLVISFEGVVKLVDFGIAKAEMRETRTRSGTIKGKFAYMSPEQCVANNVDRRTDVFALGVIGHELVTGRRLFKRPSPYETYQAVMECDVKPPSTIDAAIDPALDAVLMRAVTKDKADRYPSAEAFGDALLGYLHHRGIGSGPGDVSRFFDAHFGQELDEHSGRMRELIAGRDVSVEPGVSWGSDDDAMDPADRGSRPSGELGPGGVSFVLDGLGGGSRGEDDDEMPAERTRIETNPLERVNELERLAARGPSAYPDDATRIAPSSAVPVPPPPGAEGARAAPSPPGMPASGRFPDLANLPTVIGGAEPVMLTPPPGASEPTGALPAHARTQIAQMPGAPPDAAAAHHAPPGASGGPLPGMPPPHAPRPQSPSSPPQMPYAQGYPQANPPGFPQGYPVLNAQLSEQIATGATVFPSEPPRGSSSHPGPMTPPGMQPPGMASPPGMQPPGMASPPGMQPPGMQPPGMAPPGMAPPGMAPPGMASPPGMPPLRGSEPGGYPLQPPRMPDGSVLDAQRAANLMSPVGQQYPDQVDWGLMAESRARAVPPWLLAALFIGAIGIATALTVLIARLIS
jgi:eukaryotic-like serine/threonine-protein kinase